MTPRHVAPLATFCAKRCIVERKAAFFHQKQKKACVMSGLSVNSRPADIGV
jgi:hypothetical protein